MCVSLNITQTSPDEAIGEDAQHAIVQAHNQPTRMNDLKNPEYMGLTLPSPAWIFGALLFGLIAYAAFRRGRKSERPVLTWSGVAMMIYPYATPQTWLLWAVGVAFCGWLYLKWD